jgi:hypothetical protein
MTTGNPFKEARIIAKSGCLAIGSEVMHWVVKEAVESLRRDGYPINEVGVLRVIEYLEYAYSAEE